MRPQSYASSTIGVNTSTVAISARPSPMLQAAASSPVSADTSTSSGIPTGPSIPITVPRSPGPELARASRTVAERGQSNVRLHAASLREHVRFHLTNCADARRRRRSCGVGHVRARGSRAPGGRDREHVRDVGRACGRRRGRRRAAGEARRVVRPVHGVRRRRAGRAQRTRAHGARPHGPRRDPRRQDPARGGADRPRERTDDRDARRTAGAARQRPPPVGPARGRGRLVRDGGRPGGVRRGEEGEADGRDEPFARRPRPRRASRRTSWSGARAIRRRRSTPARSRTRRRCSSGPPDSPEGRGSATARADDGRAPPFIEDDDPDTPADAYGAGDSFAAALAYGLAAGMEIPAAIKLAARAGSATAYGRGPYTSQLTQADIDTL